MLIRLGEFLRISLEESQHKLIPLQQELDFVKKYLEIEQFRDKKLKVAISVKESHQSLKVPSFILQPLVENAIKHGISKARNAKHIEIGSEFSGGILKLYVYNEGPALTSESERKGGIGLTNTKLRLQKLYGKQSGLALLSVNDGVMVEVTMPTE